MADAKQTFGKDYSAIKRQTIYSPLYYMNNQQANLRKWVVDHLKVENALAGTWQKTWRNPQIKRVIKLRLMNHDYGMWIIIMSALEAYCSDEEQWGSINLGNAQSCEQLDQLLQ